MALSYFALVLTSFAMNLFVGAVIEAYQTLANDDESLVMTDAQKAWIELQRMAVVADLTPVVNRPTG